MHTIITAETSKSWKIYNVTQKLYRSEVEKFTNA